MVKSEHLNVSLKQPTKAWQFDPASRDWFIEQMLAAGVTIEDDGSKDYIVIEWGMYVQDGDYVVLFADGQAEAFNEQEFVARFKTS